MNWISGLAINGKHLKQTIIIIMIVTNIEPLRKAI